MSKRTTTDEIVRFIQRTLWLVERDRKGLEETKRSLVDEFRRTLPREFIEKYGERLWYEWATEENERKR